MAFPFQHDDKYRIYPMHGPDTSKRCRSSGICDWDHAPGEDGLGNITKAADRLQRVREATKWTWQGYKRYAWGLDELYPSSKTGQDWFGVGLTIVDGVDTLLIQGLVEEAQEAREWIAQHLQLRGRSMSVFESIIRILGGLLSAFYHSGGDEMYLERALEFADRVLPVFNTQSGVHVGTVTLRDPIQHGASLGGSQWVGASNLAEAGTTSVEFTTLAHITGIPIYRTKSMRFWYDIKTKMQSLDGLYCTDLDGDSLGCRQYYYGMGPASDSAYEYMLKQWVISAGQDEVCLDLYREAMHGLRKHLVVYVKPADQPQQTEAQPMLAVAYGSHGGDGKLRVSSRRVQTEHLSCFVPGMLALGHIYGQRTSKYDAQATAGKKVLPSARRQLLQASQSSQRSQQSTEDEEDDDLLLAARLARGCYDLYTRAQSGVAFDSASMSQIRSGSSGRNLHAWNSEAHAVATPADSSKAQSSDATWEVAPHGRHLQQQRERMQDSDQHQDAGSDVVQAALGVMQEQLGRMTQGRRLAAQAGQQARKHRKHGPVKIQQWQPDDDLDNKVFDFRPLTNVNYLRPEVVESLFYLYRATGDPVYQEWGWNIFRAYERFCRHRNGGYITLSNVDAVPPQATPGGKMESFWLAETLKYFYLLFAEPDVIPLDTYVFNTEAHPLPIWGSEPDRRVLDKLSPALRERLRRTQSVYEQHAQQLQAKAGTAQQR